MGYRLLFITGDKDWRADAAAAMGADYHVAAAATAAEGLNRILAGGCDLALVDLDGVDGLNWLKILRQTDAGREAPVIADSARKSDEEAVDAFEWGADDYVLKACEPAELAARVRSALRRRFERQKIWGPALAIGAVTLDPERHQCWVRRTPVALNPREFELLEILMRKSGRVLSRPYLLETVWGMSRFANTRTVDVAVSSLRRSLGKRASRWIETVERFGYRYRSSPEVAR